MSQPIQFPASSHERNRNVVRYRLMLLSDLLMAAAEAIDDPLRERDQELVAELEKRARDHLGRA